MHVQELVRLGAKIKINSNTCTIDGVDELNGTDVMATDLRASFCLIIAGLFANGTTKLHRIYHLKRGYAKLDEKLNSIGCNVKVS